MKIIDQGVVFDAAGAPAEQRFCSFSHPLVLSDGHILVTFRAGRSKDAHDENILICQSTDAGRRWETIFHGLDRFIDGVAGGWRAGYLTELGPGRLLGFFNWFDRSDPGRPLANPATEGVLPAHLMVFESDDGGRSWVRPREVDPRPYEGVAICGPALKLAGGALALPYEAWKAYDDPNPGRHHALLHISSDGAHRFEPAVVVAHDPDDRILYWDERFTVDPRTGQPIAMFWTHDLAARRDIDAHIAWGSSDGKTWTQPADAGFLGQHPYPLALPDGRVLCLYEHRHDPAGVRAVLSYDFGHTWDVQHELVVYESEAGRESGIGRPRPFMDYWGDMLRWTFGHPVPARLSNGDVFVAFYGGTAEAMSMRWARLSV